MPWEISPEQARRVLENSPSVVVLDDPENMKYPMPIMSDQEDATFVGRIREDFSIDNGLNLWIVSQTYDPKVWRGVYGTIG